MILDSSDISTVSTTIFATRRLAMFGGMIVHLKHGRNNSINQHGRRHLDAPETLEVSEIVVAFVPLLEPDASDATVPPSSDFFPPFRPVLVAVTYTRKGTWYHTESTLHKVSGAALWLA